LQGVEMTQAMAVVCTFLLAIPVAIGAYKKLSV
jgi:hypothetical protein